jgi:spermidine synthase
VNKRAGKNADKKMKMDWRYIKSFLSEEVVEVGQSQYSPGLQVWYAYGRKMLNTAKVNYSFGKLDAVFRSAFHQLKIEEQGIQNVLLLGLGAGNVPAILEEYNPAPRIVAVEIDPEVIRLAEAHFGLKERPRLEVELADATEFVFRCAERFDMVIVDVFIDDQVPEAACTEEFLQQLGRLLNPEGLLLFNRLGHTDALLQQTLDFGRKMISTLPGTYFLDADLNKVLVYEQK